MKPEEVNEEETTAVVDDSGITVINNTVNGYTTDITETVREMKSKLVFVETTDAEGMEISASGIIYRVNGKDCYIVTTASLFEDIAEEAEEPGETEETVLEESEEEEEPEEEEPSANITVYFDNSIQVKGELIGQDPSSDTAVVLVQPDFTCESVSLGDDTILQEGEYAIALSGRSPKTENGIVSFGVVSQPLQIYCHKTEFNDEAIIQTLMVDVGKDALFAGGPIVNLSGEVIGMFRNDGLDGDGMCTATSISEVRSAAEQIIQKGYVSRFYLGIIGRSVRDLELYEMSGLQIMLDVTDGVLVEYVVPGSPAEKAGIQSNDILQKIGDTTLNEMKDLQDYLYTDIPLLPQKTVLIRSGSTVTVEVSMFDEEPEELPE